MRIERLRQAHSSEKLAEIYARPHDHTKFEDHLLRVDATIALAKWLMRDMKKFSVADLSCGNAAIAKAVVDESAFAEGRLILGDFAPGYLRHGPLEETINDIPDVDLFICSETLEHLNAPEHALRKIRTKAKRLVLSTPINEMLETDNREHYWAWDVAGVAELLRRTGWTSIVRSEVSYGEWHFPYDFQIWGCR